MSNEEHHIGTADIIEANTKTFRVCRSVNIGMFTQSRLEIAPQNAIPVNFDRFSFEESLRPINSESTFGKIARRNTCSLIVGDKTKMNVIEHPNSVHRTYKFLIIQEFDIREQRLKIKQIIRSNSDIYAHQIKNVIGKCNISLFRLVALAPYALPIKYELERPSENSELSNDSSIIYQNNSLTLEAINAINDEYDEKLEPFFADFSEFYQTQMDEEENPGLKYSNLAIGLENKDFDEEKIAQCFKKACDLSPNNIEYTNYYVDALARTSDLEILEAAQKTVLEKLKLHKNKIINIHDYYLSEYFYILARIYRAHKDKKALEYFFKSIAVIQRCLAKEATGQMKSRLCERYHAVVGIHMKYKHRYDEIEILFQKIIKRFPNSAFYRKEYGNFLNNHSAGTGLVEYDKAIDIIENDKDEAWTRGCSLYDCLCAKFECLIELEKYEEAEKNALRLIEIAKSAHSIIRSELLRESYDRIIDLYTEQLDKPKCAVSYSLKMTMLESAQEGEGVSVSNGESNTDLGL